MAKLHATIDAVLTKITGPICPRGEELKAVCSQVNDVEQVERRAYQSIENEVVNMTSFLFEVADENGTTYQVSTRPMKITGHPDSNLMKFLTAWLDKKPPFGWDYCELKGADAIISVEHFQRKSPPHDVYPCVVNIAPGENTLEHVPSNNVATNEIPMPEHLKKGAL